MMPPQVVPSMGGVKVLYRRTAMPAPRRAPGAPGGAGALSIDFPALAHKMAQSFRGKAFVDQVGWACR